MGIPSYSSLLHDLFFFFIFLNSKGEKCQYVFLLGKGKNYFLGSKYKRPFQNELRSEVQKSSILLFLDIEMLIIVGAKEIIRNEQLKSKNLSSFEESIYPKWSQSKLPYFLLYFVCGL